MVHCNINIRLRSTRFATSFSFHASGFKRLGRLQVPRVKRGTGIRRQRGWMAPNTLLDPILDILPFNIEAMHLMYQ